MTDNTPLSAFSKIINDKGQWDSDWYSWLKTFAASVDSLAANVADVNYGKFFATCNGVDQVPGAGLSQVAFSAELTGATQFDTDFFRYLPDKAGWYTIYLQVWADEGQCSISLNGVTIALGVFINVDSPISITSVQTLVFLTPGDSIEGNVNIAVPGTTIYGDPTGTFMFGWRISA